MSFNTIIDRLKSDLVTLTDLPVYISTDRSIQTPPATSYINIVLESFDIDAKTSQNGGVLLLTSDLDINLVNQACQDPSRRVDFDLVNFVSDLEIILKGMHLWYPCDGASLLVEPATYKRISRLERTTEQYIQAGVKINIIYELG